MRAGLVGRGIFLSALVLSASLLSFRSSLLSIEGKTSAQDPNATLPPPKKTTTTKKTSTPAPNPSTDPEKSKELKRQLGREVEAFIKEQRRYCGNDFPTPECYEIKNSRKYAYGDLDGDGNEDAVLSYELGEGNGVDVDVAVFLNTGDSYKLAARTTLGGRSFQLEKMYIRNKRLVIQSSVFPDKSKSITSYVLSGHQLREVRDK